jgi:hypothetical protein
MRHALFCFAGLLLLSCGHKAQDVSVNLVVTTHDGVAIPLPFCRHRNALSKWSYPVKKRILKIDGDFDGDGFTETLKEQFFSGLSGSAIQTIPSNAQTSWALQHDAQTTLTCSSASISSLYLGDYNFGLVSILNLGDLNADASDEIAVVMEGANLVVMNSCAIYSYCNQTWKERLRFSIRAESWFTDTAFMHSIPGFLEKRNGEWFYCDDGEFNLGSDKFMDENGDKVFVPLAPEIRKRCE